MKKLLLLAVLFSRISYAQDSTAFEKLESKFTWGYFYAEDSRPGSTFLEKLLIASNMLDFDGEDFNSAKNEIHQHFKTKNHQQNIRILTDSLILVFAKNYLWAGHEEELKKFQPTFDIILHKVCVCYSQQLKVGLPDVAGLIKSCDEQNSKDALFTAQMNASVANFTAAERKALQKLYFTYVYQHCPAVTKFIHRAVSNEVYSKHIASLVEKDFTADQRLIQYFSDGKRDSAKLIFPGYLKFATAIKKSILFYNKEFQCAVDTRQGKTSLIFTKTFIENKTKIAGRIIYKITNTSGDIRILSFATVTADKLPADERKKILDSLTE